MAARWKEIEARWAEEKRIRHLDDTNKFLLYWNTWKTADGKSDFVEMKRKDQKKQKGYINRCAITLKNAISFQRLQNKNK